MTMPGPRDAERFLDRDLSTVAYIGRVLTIAQDSALPLLERVRFLAIVSQAIDDFFQVRVPEMRTQAATNAAARRAMPLVRSHVEALTRDQDRILRGIILPRLAAHGCELVRWAMLEPYERDILREQFERRIVPLLDASPVSNVVDGPMPATPNLGLAMLVTLHQRPATHAIVTVPPVLPRLFGLPSGRYVRLEDLIAAHRDELDAHRGWTALRFFRVTRSAELPLEDTFDCDDVELRLDLRQSGDPVRLEVQPTMPARVRDRLGRSLGLARNDVYDFVPMLDAASLWALCALELPELRAPSITPVVPPALSGPDVFAAIDRADVVVHHPYESFDASVLALLRQAAGDPDVTAIRQTLYRTSEDSPVVAALMAAARAGKRVEVVVELKARFDERANLGWSRELRRAGAHVVSGVPGLKVHAKALVIARREDGSVRSYAHVGTGNYDPSTARAYEDLSLMTAATDVTDEVHAMFDALVMGRRPEIAPEATLLAPLQLRDEILELIEAERRAPAESRQIIMKLNNLIDAEIIDALYAASRDGVEIDLIVRSSCCLRPGVPGLSERVRVRSIVGRVLEHSRVFVFGSGERARFYMGSADLMPRNLDRRVELVVPVADAAVQDRLRELLVSALVDDTRAWELRTDGSWHRPARRVGVDYQESMAAAARARLGAGAASS